MEPAAWMNLADAVGDEELARFRERICTSSGHFGLAACGTCSRCGGSTPSCSMALCDGCAAQLGVCPYDQRLKTWGSESAGDSQGIAVRWLALLARGHSGERGAARAALATFPLPGLEEAARLSPRPAGGPSRSPAPASFILGFRGPVPPEVVPGAPFLNGTVARLLERLDAAVVETPDAAKFEALAAGDPRLEFVELNR